MVSGTLCFIDISQPDTLFTLTKFSLTPKFSLILFCIGEYNFGANLFSLFSSQMFNLKLLCVNTLIYCHELIFVGLNTGLNSIRCEQGLRAGARCTHPVCASRPCRRERTSFRRPPDPPRSCTLLYLIP